MAGYEPEVGGRYTEWNLNSEINRALIGTYQALIVVVISKVFPATEVTSAPRELHCKHPRNEYRIFAIYSKHHADKS
jgi:hypothetical protein